MSDVHIALAFCHKKIPCMLQKGIQGKGNISSNGMEFYGRRRRSFFSPSQRLSGFFQDSFQGGGPVFSPADSRSSKSPRSASRIPEASTPAIRISILLLALGGGRDFPPAAVPGRSAPAAGRPAPAYPLPGDNPYKNKKQSDSFRTYGEIWFAICRSVSVNRPLSIYSERKASK